MFIAPMIIFVSELPVVTYQALFVLPNYWSKYVDLWKVKNTSVCGGGGVRSAAKSRSAKLTTTPAGTEEQASCYSYRMRSIPEKTTTNRLDYKNACVRACVPLPIDPQDNKSQGY